MDVKSSGQTMNRLISFAKACEKIMSIRPLTKEHVKLKEALGRVLASDVLAVSDCPSADVSLKDGFAVHSEDVDGASLDYPIKLSVIDTATAGQKAMPTELAHGQAVRIMTGAMVPMGASSVLAGEFARAIGKDAIYALADAHPGRNILYKGTDIRAGEIIVKAGTTLSPTHLGLLAAAGVYELEVFRLPKVAIAAIGSELVEPGKPIGPGQVAASNMVILEAELTRLGIPVKSFIFRDDLNNLKNQISPLLENFDVLLTCGGVLDGDKDYTVRAIEALGVKEIFRRVRIGPGKGVCFGHTHRCLVFNLPGGPPSNHVAFLLIALPGIKRLCGFIDPFPGKLEAASTTELKGQKDWTQLFYGRIIHRDTKIWAEPIFDKSRPKKMAQADCLLQLPEGKNFSAPGDKIPIWLIK